MLAPNIDILPQRAKGTARLATKLRDNATHIDVFYQEGAGKIRIPESFDGRMEAVLINTSGGLTGGDRIEWAVDAGKNTDVTLTTQACERIYKSSGGDAHVAARLTVAEGAALHWLPQETILFDQGALNRTLDADLADGAELIALEAILLGRKAMGETVNEGRLRDRWRIRRNGRLIHAEDLRFSGEISDIAARRSTLAGNLAFATLLYVGDGAEAMMGKLHALLGEKLAGSSQWNGKLVIRMAAEDGFALRKILVPTISLLRNGRPPPKVWNI
ncbi:urease accessory protein UreD [Rhizobium sp.]